MLTSVVYPARKFVWAGLEPNLSVRADPIAQHKTPLISAFVFGTMNLFLSNRDATYDLKEAFSRRGTSRRRPAHCGDKEYDTPEYFGRF